MMVSACVVSCAEQVCARFHLYFFFCLSQARCVFKTCVLKRGQWARPHSPQDASMCVCVPSVSQPFFSSFFSLRGFARQAFGEARRVAARRDARYGSARCASACASARARRAARLGATERGALLRVRVAVGVSWCCRDCSWSGHCASAGTVRKRLLPPRMLTL